MTPDFLFISLIFTIVLNILMMIDIGLNQTYHMYTMAILLTFISKFGFSVQKERLNIIIKIIIIGIFIFYIINLALLSLELYIVNNIIMCPINIFMLLVAIILNYIYIYKNVQKAPNFVFNTEQPPISQTPLVSYVLPSDGYNRNLVDLQANIASNKTPVMDRQASNRLKTTGGRILEAAEIPEASREEEVSRYIEERSQDPITPQKRRPIEANESEED